jgi:hypothetical protein
MSNGYYQVVDLPLITVFDKGSDYSPLSVLLDN